MNRLHIATKAAIGRINEEHRFQMALHDKKPASEYVPPKNAVEQHERVKATFAALGTTIVQG